MRLARALWVVWGNVGRNKRPLAMASIGLVVGVATFTFFVALGAGIQQGVLNKIFPVNQVELEPKTVGVMGLQETVVDESRLGPAVVKQFEELDQVVSVFPKLRSKLQARLWGGKALLGTDARAEAFFDGLDPGLLHTELQSYEGVVGKRARAAMRRQEKCARDEECRLGQECNEGICRPVEYWRRFTDRGMLVPCEGEGKTGFCPDGLACAGAYCREVCGSAGACPEGSACVPPSHCEDPRGCPGVCGKTCSLDGDCPELHGCTDSPTGAKTCQRLGCELTSPEHQLSERPRDRRGDVTGRCANGVAPDSPACERLACPGESYCATRSMKEKQGFCELPVPVLLSPFLVEMFNSSVASSYGFNRISGTDALMGFQFRLLLGDSYFAADLPREVQQLKRAEVVGFSDKALDFGVTLPISYVRRINARYKGAAAASTYDTFTLETVGNEDVSRLLERADQMGFTLARKSRDARKAADLLFILTLVFSFISIVIVVVAAVNITNTFLMIITERRYEIGIMRAVGASRWDIRKLILLESSLLGVFGGVLGIGLSYGLSRLVNMGAAEYLKGIPFKPDNFFLYEGWILVGAVALAVVFCLVGALIPANRAAGLDPAVVLTS